MDVDAVMLSVALADIYDTCGNDQLTRAEAFELLRNPTVLINKTDDSFRCYGCGMPSWLMLAAACIRSCRTLATRTALFAARTRRWVCFWTDWG